MIKPITIILIIIKTIIKLIITAIKMILQIFQSFY